MGTNESGTAATSHTTGGHDVGATLMEEIRRVLARIDAHAEAADAA